MDINFEPVYKSNLLIEQHFHGCYGVDFSTCGVDNVLFLAQKLLRHGIGGFFPTLVTDSVESIKRQISVIKQAKEKQTLEMAEILGIHLEGVFINPDKKGIHNPEWFLRPTVENYKLIESSDGGDFIKIVTLAPELDEGGELSRYLTLKGVKVQAGHCTGSDLSKCSGVTHLFNAMEGISHRNPSTALSALIDDKIYTEIIADGIHLSDEILELVFKCKPENKVILVSDSLPITGVSLPSPLETVPNKTIEYRFVRGKGVSQHEERVLEKLGEGSFIKTMFAGSEIFYDGKKATSKEGTIAGSTAVLDELIKRHSCIKPEKFDQFVRMASDNLYQYHGVKLDGCVYWDDDFNIIAVEKSGSVLYKNI